MTFYRGLDFDLDLGVDDFGVELEGWFSLSSSHSRLLANVKRLLKLNMGRRENEMKLYKFCPDENISRMWSDKGIKFSPCTKEALEVQF